MRKTRDFKIFRIIREHVINNSKEYIIVALIFIIGLFIGVLFVNNIQEAQRAEITSYLNNFISKFKENSNIDNMELLKEAIGQNFLIAVVIWFFGTTVIGIPVVFGIILYRGFCLGYTIAVCVSILGISKGLPFVLSSLLLQNILFIPAILALAVSGFKLYKSIVKNQKKENVKLEILRHTVFSLIMLIVLAISALAEVFLSTNILKIIIKYL